MIILTATNVDELGKEWDCFIDLMSSNGPVVITEPFISKRLAITLTDVSLRLYNLYLFSFAFSGAPFLRLRLFQIICNVMQVEVAQPLSEICSKFPDLYIGKRLFTVDLLCRHGLHRFTLKGLIFLILVGA